MRCKPCLRSLGHSQWKVFFCDTFPVFWNTVQMVSFFTPFFYCIDRNLSCKISDIPQYQWLINQWSTDVNHKEAKPIWQLAVKLKLVQLSNRGGCCTTDLKSLDLFAFSTWSKTRRVIHETQNSKYLHFITFPPLSELLGHSILHCFTTNCLIKQLAPSSGRKSVNLATYFVSKILKRTEFSFDDPIIAIQISATLCLIIRYNIIWIQVIRDYLISDYLR